MSKTAFPKTFHVLASGFTVTLGEGRAESSVMYQGQTFTVTEAQYEFTTDKNGHSWIDLTPDEQEARWGHQKFSEGPAPEGVEIGADDTHGLMYRRWQSAVQNAEQISDPIERATAFKEIKAKFPTRYASTQRTIRTY